MDKGNSWVRLLGASVVGLAMAGTALARDSEECQSFTAGEVAGVLLQGNQGDVSLGQAAALRSQDPDVRAYAQQIADDSYKASQSLLQAFAQANIPVEDSRLRRDIAEFESKELDDFWRQESGPELDQVFIEVEIDDHQEALNFLDRTLIPNAQTPEIRDALMQQRQMIAQHLDMAQTLWGRMMGQQGQGGYGEEPGGYEEEPGGMNKGEEEYGGEEYGGERGGEEYGGEEYGGEEYGGERGNAPRGGEQGNVPGGRERGAPRQQPGNVPGGQQGNVPGGQQGTLPGGQRGGGPR